MHTNQYIGWVKKTIFNTLGPRQTDGHVSDDSFKCILLNENVWISISISLKLVPEGQINNIPALIQIMAWRRPGGKPLSESIMFSLLTNTCVTQTPWVKRRHCKTFLYFDSNFTEFCSWVRNWQYENTDSGNGPVARHVKLRLLHASGMPGTCSLPARVSDPDMHHGTCVTRVPWCMPGSLTSGFLWSQWRWKRSRHSRRMRNPQFYISGKRPMTWYQTDGKPLPTPMATQITCTNTHNQVSNWNWNRKLSVLERRPVNHRLWQFVSTLCTTKTDLVMAILRFDLLIDLVTSSMTSWVCNT